MKAYAFPKSKEFLDFMIERQKISIDINEEKILKEDQKMYRIVNDIIAYFGVVASVILDRMVKLNCQKIILETT